MQNLTRRTLFAFGVVLLSATAAVARKLGVGETELPPGRYTHSSFGPRTLVVGYAGRRWERV